MIFINSTYHYSGPVLEFDRCIANVWTSSTQASSESKARNNLIYQFKKYHNRLPNTKISLPGKIVKVN